MNALRLGFRRLSTLGSVWGLTLIVAAGIGGSLGAQAGEDPELLCIKPDIARRLALRFTVSVERDPKLCQPNSFTEKIYEALHFGEALELAAPYPAAPWNQDIVGLDWMAYLVNLAPTITGASHDPLGNGCNDITLAYVRGPEAPKTIYICKGLFDERLSVGERISTLLHEARHHEGFAHIRCKQGPLKDTFGCDERAEVKGSYAVDLEVLSKIAASAQNVHPATRLLAASEAIQTADENFNVRPYDIFKYLFLTDADGQTYRFDGREISSAGALFNVGDRLIVPRAFSEILVFPLSDLSARARRIRSFDGLNASELPGGAGYIGDYNTSSAADRVRVKDVFFTPLLTGRIYGNNVMVARDEGDGFVNYETQWSEGQPLRIFTAKDLAIDNPNRAYVLNDRSELFRIEMLGHGKKLIKKVDNPVKGFKMLAQLGDATYALSGEGELMVRKDQKFVPVPEQTGQRFVEMSREFQTSPGLSWAEAVWADQ